MQKGAVLGFEVLLTKTQAADLRFFSAETPANPADIKHVAHNLRVGEKNGALADARGAETQNRRFRGAVGSYTSILKSSPRELTTWALVSPSQAMGSSSSASTGFAAASSSV